MQTIVEISYYPFQTDYTPPILAFIERLRNMEGLEVKVGETASVIRGDYDEVMTLLAREMRVEMGRGRRVSFVLKVLNTEN